MSSSRRPDSITGRTQVFARTWTAARHRRKGGLNPKSRRQGRGGLVIPGEKRSPQNVLDSSDITIWLSWRARRRVRQIPAELHIEEGFAWVKTIAGLAKTRFRGRPRVDAAFTFALAAYNLIRLPKLLAEPT